MDADSSPTKIDCYQGGINYSSLCSPKLCETNYSASHPSIPTNVFIERGKRLFYIVHIFHTKCLPGYQLALCSSTLSEMAYFSPQYFTVPRNMFIRLCVLWTAMISYFVSGARRLREYTKKNIISQKRELGEILKEERIKKEFEGLKKKRKPILSGYQYKILYPEPGTKFQEDKVDISLWVILARHLIRQERYIAWDQDPGPDDNLWGHHMLR